MNVLSIQIIPTPDANDHQVRLLIDGEDWLRDEYFGIDPPQFFAQQTFLGGSLLVGRCGGCGVVGCDDVVVDVDSDDEIVRWKIRWGPERADLEFATVPYTAFLERSKTDFSWEDVKRRTERLLNTMFADFTIEEGYRFDWASCRIEEKKVVLSFSSPHNIEQKFLKLDWDGISEDSAIAGAKQILAS